MPDGYEQELTVCFIPWRATDDDAVTLEQRLLERTATAQSTKPTVTYAPEGLLLGRLTVRGMLRAIDFAARGECWALAVWFEPQPMPLRVARRLTPKATSAPTGLAVKPSSRDPRVAPVAAVLQLHVAILRTRSEATWRAIDARREHATHTAAAKVLGCSQQAVSKHVRGGNLRATAGTHAVLTALLQGPASHTRPQTLGRPALHAPSSSLEPSTHSSVDSQPRAVEEAPEIAEVHNPPRLGPFSTMFGAGQPNIDEAA